MATKFKIGERVKFNCERLSEHHHGQTGFISEVISSDFFIVTMDNFTVPRVSITGGYLVHETLSPFDQKVHDYIRGELHNV